MIFQLHGDAWRRSENCDRMGISQFYSLLSRAPTRKPTKRLRLKLFCLNWIDERIFSSDSSRMFAKRKHLLARFVNEKWFFICSILSLGICLANPSSAIKDGNSMACEGGDEEGWRCRVKDFIFGSNRRGGNKYFRERYFCRSWTINEIKSNNFPPLLDDSFKTSWKFRVRALQKET